MGQSSSTSPPSPSHSSPYNPPTNTNTTTTTTTTTTSSQPNTHHHKHKTKHRRKFKPRPRLSLGNGATDRSCCLSDSGRKLFYQALDSPTQAPASSGKVSTCPLANSKLVNAIEQFRLAPQNKFCADCSDRSSSWASVTHGVFLCALCVGAHRSLGSDMSFTQSTRLDPSYWTPECVQAFKSKGGNAAVNRVLEYYVPTGIKKPALGIPGHLRRQYIRQKYVDKAFTQAVTQQPHPLSPVVWQPEKTLKHSPSLALGRAQYVGIVNLKVIRGEDISSPNQLHKAVAKATTSQAINPFLVLQLGSHMVNTSAKKHTSSPEWNESPLDNLKLSLPWNGQDSLKIAAWSCEHLMKDVLLGKAVLDITNLDSAACTSSFSEDEEKEKEYVQVWVDLYRLKVKRPCTCDDHTCQPEPMNESDESEASLPQTRKREYSLSKIPRYIGHNIKAKAVDTVDSVKKVLPLVNGESEKHRCKKCKNVTAVPAGRVLLGLNLLLLGGNDR